MDLETRQNKVKKIKERILTEIEKEKSFYVSALKQSFICIDYNAKMIFLLNILEEYVLKNETFSDHFYCNGKLTYVISDNTLNMLLTYSFSLVVKWLDNFTENNGNIFNLDDFLNDNFFEYHLFSTFEKMSSAHFE